MPTGTHTVWTQHGADRDIRSQSFPDYDSALAYARATNPDTDPTMCPNVDDAFGDRPDYERGIFWVGNRYAVITRGGK